jgi:peptidoglycan/LPS O-acetylase OafA/YrhL
VTLSQANNPDSVFYSQRLRHVDALRAVAVLLVVLAHSGLKFVPGGYGVTLFFVISGFVISSLLISEFRKTSGFDVRKYAIRRFLKIAPPLIAIVIVPSLILKTLLGLDLEAISRQIFFVYNWYKMEHESAGVLPGSAVVWSLSIEEQFYFVLATLWLLLIRTKHAIFLLTLTATAGWLISTFLRFYFASQHLIHDNTGNVSRIYYGSDTRMSSIWIGVMLSVVIQSNSKNSYFYKIKSILLHRQSYLLGIFLLFLSLSIRNEFFRDSLRFSIQEIASMIFVASATKRECWPLVIGKVASLRFVQEVGKGSYSIYLVHLTAIVALNHFFDLRGISYVIACLLLSVSFGLVCHRLFDSPFENLRRRYRTTVVKLPD